MKPSLSLEVSTPFDMALKLLLLLHMALKRLLFLHQEHAAAFQDVSKNLVLLMNLKQNILVSRKLPMQTLQKLHLSNSLYIEQYTSHLLILLSSTRACSETTKQNSVCFEISRACFLWKLVNWFALQIGWLISLWCLKCEDFAWFQVGQFFVEHTVSADFWSSYQWNLRILCFFDGNFLAGGFLGCLYFCTV